VKKIACGRWTSAAVTESGTLYFWGRFESSSNVHRMKKIKTPSPVIDAGCAGNYLFFVTATRKFYKVEEEGINLQIEKQGKSKHVVRSVACTRQNAYFLTKNSELFEFSARNNATAEMILKDVVDFACGEEHVIFLTKKGQVLSIGQNGEYQRGGLVSYSERSASMPLPPRQKISQIGAGKSFSLMVTSNGNLFFLGSCQRIFGYSEMLRMSNLDVQASPVFPKF
jgi:alpha-tubulin suppressor-like RCC1 family protein